MIIARSGREALAVMVSWDVLFLLSFFLICISCFHGFGISPLFLVVFYYTPASSKKLNTFLFFFFLNFFPWVALSLRCVHCSFPLAIVQKIKIMAQREFVPFLGLEILVELHTRFSMHSRPCRTQNWALIIKLNTEENVSQVTMLEYIHDGRRCRTDVAYWATYSLEDAYPRWMVTAESSRLALINRGPLLNQYTHTGLASREGLPKVRTQTFSNVAAAPAVFCMNVRPLPSARHPSSGQSRQHSCMT